MENMKKGARAFRCSPLRCIPKHHAVFRGRLIIRNHSVVAGSSAVAEQQSMGATTIDVPSLTEMATATPLLAAVARGRGLPTVHRTPAAARRLAVTWPVTQFIAW